MSQSNPAGLCPVTHCGVLCFTLSWTEVVELLHQVQMGVLPPYSIIRKHLFKKKKCFPCWVSCNLSMTVAQNRIWQLSPTWHRSNMTYIRFMDVSFFILYLPTTQICLSWKFMKIIQLLCSSWSLCTLQK